MGMILRLLFFCITAGLSFFIIMAVLGLVIELVKKLLPLAGILIIAAGAVFLIGFVVVAIVEIFNSADPAGISFGSADGGTSFSISNTTILLLLAAVGVPICFLAKKLSPVIDAFVARLAAELKANNDHHRQD